jgi:hypothetical protein
MGLGGFLKKTFLGPLGSPMTGASESSTDTEQTQSSSGLSINRGSSSSTSGGTSRARSMGTTGSMGRSGSSSSVFAGDVFQQLYGDALGAAAVMDPSLANERINQLFTGGMSIMDTLNGGGSDTDYLERRLAGDNGEVLNAQIDALGSDLGRFLNEQVMPGIAGDAVAAGQLGGGRQGVAEGMAVNDTMRTFATQAANLRAADVANRDAAALGLYGLKTQRGQGQLSALQGLADIGTTDASLDPYQQLSMILGGPQVLTDSFGEESSFGQTMSEEESQQYAESLASEFGISIDQAKAMLTSRSRGRGQGDIGSTLTGFGNLGQGIGASMGGGFGMG